MTVGDIYQIFVKFGSDSDNLEGNERYTVEIAKVNLTVVLLDSMISQYKDKSDYIKLQYYPIRDWRQAGLQKSPYIDIRSTMSFDFREILSSGKYIGQLSHTDVIELTKFIQNYTERFEAHIKANPN